MRLSRSVAVAVLSALSLIGLVASAQAATGRYVALGDSYSSGHGADDYGNSGVCYRSSNAYPQLWANAHAPSSFAFVACSGNTTSDLTANQISAVTSNTSLVTVSIGGNDAKLGDVMWDCNTSLESTCVTLNEKAQAFIRGTLPARLDDVYRQIRDRAPSARVIVMGYPHIYELGGFCPGLSEGKREAINQTSDVLAQVISARAAAAGFTFIDGRQVFAGHEVCADTEWITSPPGTVSKAAYHPNVAGQRDGYYAALRRVTG
ncbi:SGNH/GDSL hydrolase family protein [Actinokineospora iranica]|uniref:GDSL-like Lipase/Acylhydrolase family protein n=1 Tax=Actinokineospora iranica TaxID=1271860 RepID=A0A1G6W7E0_9PSEU|nr:SGNH/GDSL hydrolase family protein [Actinokineospora iranica]SDD60965.1 GDSL-like Lipase/Acylhydrolase family protein [Actinokineospora iranica]